MNPYEKFLSHVKSSNLVSDGDRVLLAVSAGKDSIAMLHMMAALRNEISFDMGVFHLNHMTRGAESDGDEEFVRMTCEGMGLVVLAERVDVNALRPGGISFEEFAREKRYELLQKAASRDGFNKIATAHNMDDNAETLLMRIFSGTGIYGLKGIPASRENIIRPMLKCSGGEIYSYLESLGLSWREDSSNCGDKYLRNYVRNRIIPCVSKRFPYARLRLNSLAAIASEYMDLTDKLLETAYPGYLKQYHDRVEISHPGLAGNIPAIKHIIATLLNRKFNVKVSLPVLDEIIRNYNSPRSNNTLYFNGSVVVKKLYAPGGGVIEISSYENASQVQEKWQHDISLQHGETVDIPGICGNILIEKSTYSDFLVMRGGRDNLFISCKPGTETIIIRNRRDGDRIRLESGTSKIKDIMIEKKLDSDTKNKVPIIETGGEIAALFFGAVSGHNNRVSCNFLVHPDSERILRIKFSGIQQGIPV